MAVVAGVLPVVGRLVVFFVSFVFSVSPSGVCSVVSARSGRRLSGAALAAVSAAVLAPVRLRSSVLRGACRSVRSLRRSPVSPSVRLAVLAVSRRLLSSRSFARRARVAVAAVSGSRFFSAWLRFGSCRVFRGGLRSPLCPRFAWRVLFVSLPAARCPRGCGFRAVFAGRAPLLVALSSWWSVGAGGVFPSVGAVRSWLRGLLSSPSCGGLRLFVGFGWSWCFGRGWRRVGGGGSPVPPRGGRRPSSVPPLSLVARASVWVCASLVGFRAFPSSSVALLPVSVPVSAGERFAACRASLLAGVFRVGRVSVAPSPSPAVRCAVARAVSPSSPLPVWASASGLVSALPAPVPLSSASALGSLLSLSSSSFLSAVAAGRCPLSLLLSSFSWPLRSCVLWALARVLGSGRVACVVGGAPFRAPALSFLVAGLRSLGFRSFAPSLVGSRSWCAAALRFLVRRCGVVVPPSVVGLSGVVSPGGLAAVFPALSACLSRLSVRSRGVSCPPALRPALSVCLFRLFLSLFPPFGC